MMMINKRMVMTGMGLFKTSNIKNFNFQNQAGKRMNNHIKTFFSTSKNNNKENQ